MIGYETSQWYYHDGKTWVRGEPPPLAVRVPSPPVQKPTAAQRIPTWRGNKALWIGAIGVLALLVVLAVRFAGPGTTSAPTPMSPEPQAGATKVLDKAGITLVYVPAGEFRMGSTDSDPEAQADEKPQHRVYLDGYWIGRTEVINAQYREFIRASGYFDPQYWTADGWQWRESNKITEPLYWTNSTWNGDDYPVVGVSWYEAAAYARWAGARLPTEAEWEKATRGTDGRLYPWGNNWDGTRLNFCEKSCSYDWKDTAVDDGYATTAPVWFVGAASPYGALGMAGNVWEWVADWYSPVYYGASSERNPSGPGSGGVKVERGGSWNNSRGGARCACRFSAPPAIRCDSLGFRVAE